MTADWQELMNRILDGGELTDDENRSLVAALGVPETRRRAARWLIFDAQLRRKFDLAESHRIELARERLLARILLREKSALVASGAKPRRRVRWIFALSAAAAAVVVAVGWWTLAHAYAAPVAEGDFRVLRSGQPVEAAAPLQRGDLLVAGPAGCRLSLGGYCHLEADPNARLVLAGEKGNETVALEVGRLTSKVDPNRGHFRVHTPSGDIDVVGTEFVTIVKDVPQKGDVQMSGLSGRLSKVVTVMVASGAVLCNFGGETLQLGPGENHVFAAEKPSAPAPGAPVPAAPKPLGKLTADASKITLDVKDAPLAEVLQTFARQSGNAPLNLPNDLAEKTVTLSVKDVPYWQALDKLCQTVGAVYQSNLSGRTGGLALLPLGKASDLGVSTGPVSVKITQASSSLNLRPVGPGPQPLTSVNYQFAFFWEDRMPVVQSEGFVLKATLPDGRECFQFGWPKGVQAFRTVRVGPAQAIPSDNMFFMTTDLPEGVEKLASLEGIVRLSASVGPDRELKVDDVLGEGEKTGEKDGLKLLVTATNKALGRNSRVQLNIKATRDGNPVDVPVEQQQGSRYGAFLIDPDGKRYSALGVGLSGMGATVWGAGPDGKPVRVEEPAAKGQAKNSPTVSLTFFNLPKIDGEWSLLVVYPGDTETKEFPFKIQNVPVP